MAHSVALVDDHHLVREGLASTINSFADYEVVIEAGNGAELIDMLGSLKGPAIGVVDLHMPVMDGYATIAWLTANRPHMLVLALTFDASEDALVKAIRAGARGFLRKNARSALLKHALDSLVTTGYFQLSEAHHELLDQGGTKTRDEQEREAILAQMTPREIEFLRLVCDPGELTYEEIAKRMGVQTRTVDNHRQALFTKFHIRSKAGLVLFAYKWGFVTP